MSELKVTGKVIAIKQTQVVSDKFKKRVIWIETQDQYQQRLELQFVQDKVNILDNYAKDDIVEISFNLRGRSWQNKEGEAKVFNTLQAWKISKVKQVSQPEQFTSAMTSEKDDLPF